MTNQNYGELAKRFTSAMRTMVNNESALIDFENYLSVHFPLWLEKYASTPEDIISEFQLFSIRNEPLPFN